MPTSVEAASTSMPSVPVAVCGNICTPTPRIPTTTSALPSPVMSPIATEWAELEYPAAVAYETGGASVPSERCAKTNRWKSTDGLDEYHVVITTSFLPSPVTSPIATAFGDDPTESA